MRATGAVDVALCSLMYRILQSRDAVRQSSGPPNFTWPIFLLLAPLFWLVNSNMVNISDLRSVVLEVYMKTVFPQDRVTSLRWKGVLSDVEALYSTG